MNYDQDQFCLSGVIQPNGTPLAPCVYETRNTNHYNVLPMGSSNIEGNSYIRIPPNMKVYTYNNSMFGAPTSDATVMLGSSGIQSISNNNAYTVRTMSQCTYMSDCYNHRNGMTPELCQGYWTTEVPCEDRNSLFFPPGTNRSIFYLIGITILIIIFIVIICLMIIVARREFEVINSDCGNPMRVVTEEDDAMFWGM